MNTATPAQIGYIKDLQAEFHRLHDFTEPREEWAASILTHALVGNLATYAQVQVREGKANALPSAVAEAASTLEECRSKSAALMPKGGGLKRGPGRRRKYYPGQTEAPAPAPEPTPAPAPKPVPTVASPYAKACEAVAAAEEALRAACMDYHWERHQKKIEAAQIDPATLTKAQASDVIDLLK